MLTIYQSENIRKRVGHFDVSGRYCFHVEGAVKLNFFMYCNRVLEGPSCIRNFSPSLKLNKLRCTEDGRRPICLWGSSSHRVRIASWSLKGGCGVKLDEAISSPWWISMLSQVYLSVVFFNLFLFEIFHINSSFALWIWHIGRVRILQVLSCGRSNFIIVQVDSIESDRFLAALHGNSIDISEIGFHFHSE